MQYFKNVPAPFENSTDTYDDLEIIKCCYRFLKNDLIYYKAAWKWSNFFQIYYQKYADKNSLQKLFCNKVLGLIINMTDHNLVAVKNSDIPMDTKISLEIEMNNKKQLFTLPQKMRSEIENVGNNWSFDSETVFTVEGITLPIYDRNNRKSYIDHISANKFDKVVLVQSTKSNLKSLALGISIGRAICLAGGVGCGKTTLVEYLAKQTGRIAPKIDLRILQERDINTPPPETNQNESNFLPGTKRKFIGETWSIDREYVQLNSNRNGYLRIQLGDQTDSKMLLGQYRCTDVPGEFIWQPGVLTKVSVLNSLFFFLNIFIHELFFFNKGCYAWILATFRRFRFGNTRCYYCTNKFT